LLSNEVRREQEFQADMDVRKEWTDSEDSDEKLGIPEKVGIVLKSVV
jgi:hypothetical protein